MMKKAIIIGASSGIGKELANVLSAKGYLLGLAARRTALLEELQGQLAEKSFIKRIDIADPVGAMQLLAELVEEMNGTDMVIVCAAVCPANPDINWQQERDTIGINVTGVAAVLDQAFHYFRLRGGGHIVGISSFKALRGGSKSPAYNASKAFLSNYLEGLRFNAQKRRIDIAVTDIRPGFVATSLTSKRNSLLVMPVDTAARQICGAIERRKRVAYIPAWYRLIACLMSTLPSGLYRRL